MTRKLAPHVQAAIAAAAQPKQAARNGVGAGKAGTAGIRITSHPSAPPKTIQKCCLIDCLVAWWTAKKSTEPNAKKSDDLGLLSTEKDLESQQESKKKPSQDSGKFHTCSQGQTVKGRYGDSVHGGYVSSCALVIFRRDGDFICFHAPGGGYYPGKSSYADVIDYVATADRLQSSALVKTYEKDYRKYQEEYHCTLNFYSQEGTPHVTVDKDGVKNKKPALELIASIS